MPNDDIRSPFVRLDQRLWDDWPVYTYRVRQLRRPRPYTDPRYYNAHMPVCVARTGLSYSARQAWRRQVVPVVFAKYGSRCYYCGAEEAEVRPQMFGTRKQVFDCHEVFHFDDRCAVVTLVSIVPACIALQRNFVLLRKIEHCHKILPMLAL